MKVIHTDGHHEHFSKLVKLLDEDLYKRYGELQKTYNAYNKLDKINDVVIIEKDGIAVACGAFKAYNTTKVELKRLFVREAYRKQGLAKLIIQELETLAKEKGFLCMILETGDKQVEAVKLYHKLGYEVTDNYPPYVGNNNICMVKTL